jgi:hypothetical protein
MMQLPKISAVRKKHKISFTQLLLFVIIVILVLGFWKEEIRLNQPRITNKSVESLCLREIENEKYEEFLFVKRQECYQREGIKPRFGAYSSEDFSRCDNWARSLKDAPPETIQVTENCFSKERWFYALGRYWFKF